MSLLKGSQVKVSLYLKKHDTEKRNDHHDRMKHPENERDQKILYTIVPVTKIRRSAKSSTGSF